MELERVDTLRAYELIRRKVITLELQPGTPINDQRLADELGLGMLPVREALKLLAHDDLVVITPRHGLYVADVIPADLQQISEVRLALETLCARLAAQRATPDELAVLEALRQEQAATPAQDSRRLFDLDCKFHQAIARAAHNRYLARTLDHLFGLSQRLWYLQLPHLDFLPTAVQKHLELVAAIKARDAELAASLMHEHVLQFYEHVTKALPPKP
jgi:DNA-binding GntR family transcriptional regulator